MKMNNGMLYLIAQRWHYTIVLHYLQVSIFLTFFFFYMINNEALCLEMNAIFVWQTWKKYCFRYKRKLSLDIEWETKTQSFCKVDVVSAEIIKWI